MDELTGKRKRFLRSLGQSLSPAAAIGKGGLSGQAVENISRLLADRELVKIKLPEGPQRKRIAPELADAVGATCVGVVGRTALLYRPNDDLDLDKRINFPK